MTAPTPLVCCSLAKCLDHREVEDALKDVLLIRNVYVTAPSCVLICQVGPGALGVMIWPADDFQFVRRGSGSKAAAETKAPAHTQA